MTDFWEPLDLARLLAEKSESARYENLIATSPLSPDEALQLRTTIAADREARRAS